MPDNPPQWPRLPGLWQNKPVKPWMAVPHIHWACQVYQVILVQQEGQGKQVRGIESALGSKQGSSAHPHPGLSGTSTETPEPCIRPTGCKNRPQLQLTS